MRDTSLLALALSALEIAYAATETYFGARSRKVSVVGRHVLWSLFLRSHNSANESMASLRSDLTGRHANVRTNKGVKAKDGDGRRGQLTRGGRGSNQRLNLRFFHAVNLTRRPKSVNSLF
jgi:hypothetical protein